MKFKTINSIFISAIVIFWAIPLKGKKYVPDLFGIAPVQWACSTITAINSMNRMIADMLVHTQRIFVLYLGSFVIITTSGLAWHVYKRKSI